MKNRETKVEASRVAQELLELAIENSGSNLELAKKQAELARRLLLKFNLRFDRGLKRYYCRGCKQLIIPGVNTRVRLGHGTTILRLTCSGCGHVNRMLIRRQA
jgi:ribonuclease P protein subunit RPR2